jgi:hypothetical protein
MHVFFGITIQRGPTAFDWPDPDAVGHGCFASQLVDIAFCNNQSWDGECLDFVRLRDASMSGKYWY